MEEAKFRQYVTITGKVLKVWPLRTTRNANPCLSFLVLFKKVIEDDNYYQIIVKCSILGDDAVEYDGEIMEGEIVTTTGPIYFSAWTERDMARVSICQVYNKIELDVDAPDAFSIIMDAKIISKVMVETEQGKKLKFTLQGYDGNGKEMMFNASLVDEEMEKHIHFKPGDLIVVEGTINAKAIMVDNEPRIQATLFPRSIAKREDAVHALRH